MSWVQPIDVTTWEPYATEPRGGRREKRWVTGPNGQRWLRKMPPRPDPKRPHTARRSEPAIEVLALQLAHRCELATADTRLAFWETPTGVERGVVSLQFHAPDETHHPGAELLGLSPESGSDEQAKRRRDEGRASASLDAVRAKLVDLENAYGAALLAPFVRILAMDAWLGNGDRHSGNWALIRGPRGSRLAPMYDPTACLGVELTDDRRELCAPTDSAVDRYIRRCPSGFGGGGADGRTGIPMAEVLTQLATWSEWPAAISELVPRFRHQLDGLPTVLHAISDEWLSPQRKAFVSRVLAARVRLFNEGS